MMLASAPPAARIAFRVFVRLVVPGLAFFYLSQQLDAGGLASALRRVSALAAVKSLGWLAFGVVLGVARWRSLLHASGALSLPSWRTSIRLYLVGMFYNLLPGAVGGDVYRGYATRRYFADAAAARSLGVVMLERVLGLAGLFLVGAVAALASPFRGLSVLLYATAGLAAVLCSLFALTLGRRVSKYLPQFLARVLDSIPVADRLGPLVLALLFSVATQIVASMNGYAVLESLVPSVSFVGAMAIFPLGTFASYFPFTVAGAGARDTALALLLAKIGVERADALATSLLMLAGNVVVSTLGGIFQVSGVEEPPQVESRHGAG